MGGSSFVRTNSFFILIMVALTAPGLCARVKKRTGGKESLNSKESPNMQEEQLGVLPPGDYQLVCKECQVLGPVLYCKYCPDAEGNMVEATAAIASCDSPHGFVNNRGKLECWKWKGEPSPPPAKPTKMWFATAKPWVEQPDCSSEQMTPCKSSKTCCLTQGVFCESGEKPGPIDPNGIYIPYPEHDFCLHCTHSLRGGDGSAEPCLKVARQVLGVTDYQWLGINTENPISQAKRDEVNAYAKMLMESGSKFPKPTPPRTDLEWRVY